MGAITGKALIVYDPGLSGGTKKHLPIIWQRI
jgi:hypothetical protein